MENHSKGNSGWVCLHRKILENPISNKSNYLCIWIHLLLMANHQETTFIWNNKKQILKKGQLLTGIKKLSEKTGVEKVAVQTTVEAFMEAVKDSLTKGENVYLRGFGSFIVKARAEKTGRNISENTTIKIPAHNVPAFKPSKEFVGMVKESKLELAK